MIDLSIYKGIINNLFTDKMDIYRHHTSINSDGTTKTALSESPIYTDIPCRISFSRTIDLTTDITINRLPIRLIPKVFCDIDVDIKAGDYIIIRRNNAEYKGLAGKSNMYETHQEISMTVEGDA